MEKERERKMTTNRRYPYQPARLACVELENAIQDGKVILWTLTAIYEDELIEEPHRREIFISNIERQKDNLLLNITGVKEYVEEITNIHTVILVLTPP
jgi:hypothetical protein